MPSRGPTPTRLRPNDLRSSRPSPSSRERKSGRPTPASSVAASPSVASAQPLSSRKSPGAHSRSDSAVIELIDAERATALASPPKTKGRTAVTSADLRPLARENAALRQQIRGMRNEEIKATERSFLLEQQQQRDEGDFGDVATIQRAEAQVRAAIVAERSRLDDLQRKSRVVEEGLQRANTEIAAARVVRKTRANILRNVAAERDEAAKSLEAMKREHTDVLMRIAAQEDAAKLARGANATIEQQLCELDAQLAETVMKLKNENDGLEVMAARNRELTKKQHDQMQYIEALAKTVRGQQREIANLEQEVSSGIPSDGAAREALESMMGRHLTALQRLSEKTTGASTAAVSPGSRPHRYLRSAPRNNNANASPAEMAAEPVVAAGGPAAAERPLVRQLDFDSPPPSGDASMVDPVPPLPSSVEFN